MLPIRRRIDLLTLDLYTDVIAQPQEFLEHRDSESANPFRSFESGPVC